MMLLPVKFTEDCYHCDITDEQCFMLTGIRPEYNLIGERPSHCPLIYSVEPGKGDMHDLKCISPLEYIDTHR